MNRKDVLDSDDDTMFVISNNQCDEQPPAEAPCSKYQCPEQKPPQLRCEDIFVKVPGYNAGCKGKKKVDKKGKCPKCDKSREYLDYLARELNSFKIQHELPNSACTRKTAPKRKRRTRKRQSCCTAETARTVASNRYPCYCLSPCPSAHTDNHATCVESPRAHKVPKNMGWNWQPTTTERKGWRPGAIPKQIRGLMSYFLSQNPHESSYRPPLPIAGRVPPVQRPMIQVQRHNDEYAITMQPLKGAAQLRTAADPFAECEPIQVRISARKQREDERITQIKQEIHQRGFRRCRCGQPVAQCTCRATTELTALKKCVRQAAKRLGVDRSVGEVLSINRRPKDMMLDFTPPAGVVRQEWLENQNAQDCRETMYDETDIPPDPCATETSVGKGKGKAKGKGKTKGKK